jgi:hypothetical protein
MRRMLEMGGLMVRFISDVLRGIGMGLGVGESSHKKSQKTEHGWNPRYLKLGIEKQ